MTSTTPMPIPPLQAAYGDPQVTFLRVVDDRQTPNTFSYKMNYLSRSIRQTPKPMLVRAIARHGDDCAEIQCELTVSPSPTPHEYYYLLCGGNLCGRLMVMHEPFRLSPSGAIEGGRTRLAYDLVAGDAINDIDITTQFITAASTGATLTITASDSGRTVCDAILRPVEGFDSEALGDALRELATQPPTATNTG